MVRRICFYSMIMVLAASALAGCGPGKADRTRLEPIPVKVMKVGLEDIGRTIEYVGNIKGKNEALVYPKVSGKIIEKAREDGSPVNKGEPIVYVDRDEVGLKFEKAPVESPISGVVGRVYVDIGSTVKPETAVALVSDMSEARVELDIPERYLPVVSLDQEADIIVDAYPNEKFTGRVGKMSPVVDLATRAAPIEIILKNPQGRLRSGMFAKVRLQIEKREKAPVILKEAIIGKAADTYVYAVEGKKASLRKVGLGIRQGPYVEVEKGLKEGDLVVIMGQQRLKDGALVEAEE